MGGLVATIKEKLKGIVLLFFSKTMPFLLSKTRNTQRRFVENGRNENYKEGLNSMSNLQTETSSYLTLNPNGKTETRIEKIDGNYVFASCNLYFSKEDSECVVSEVGVAERKSGEEIGIACSRAVDNAYLNAVKRIDRVVGSSSHIIMAEPQAAQKSDQAMVEEAPQQTDEKAEETALSEQVQEESFKNEDAKQLPLELTNASNTDVVVEEKSAEKESAASVESYLDVVAGPDVLGKLNPLSGSTIRQILEKEPGLIIEFCSRYSGRNETVKSAMKKALPDAMRQVNSQSKRAA